MVRLRLQRPRGIGIPILLLLAGMALLLIAYDSDQHGRLFALRQWVPPWLQPVEGYVIGLMLIVGALYAIVRKSLVHSREPRSTKG
jgi:hypothetical protein